MGVKLKTEYDAVLHMPVLKEGKNRAAQLPGTIQEGSQPGEDTAATLRTTAVWIFPFFGFLIVLYIFLRCNTFFTQPPILNHFIWG